MISGLASCSVESTKLLTPLPTSFWTLALNNLQSGFLGGASECARASRFQPGEWKPVDFTGDDIKKHIFPLPTKEPSEVLFKLLETLVTSGKELASVAEIFVGKMPGQNTPATTTMATIEQGLKVFTAIYKRIFRALGKEYAEALRAELAAHGRQGLLHHQRPSRSTGSRSLSEKTTIQKQSPSSRTLTRTSSARHRSSCGAGDGTAARLQDDQSSGIH
jgi:hypothetical protein